jgi:hypothetical protein
MRKRLIFFIFVDVKYKDTKYYDLHLYNLEKHINCFDCCTFHLSLKEFSDENLAFANEIIKRITAFASEKDLEFKFRKNTVFREAECFDEEVISRIKSETKEIVFFAHARGLSHGVNESDFMWIASMYYFNLGFISEVDRHFLDVSSRPQKIFYGFPFSDCDKIRGEKFNWFYPGTFYWIKCDSVKYFSDIFSFGLYEKHDRCFAEDFPGCSFPADFAATHKDEIVNERYLFGVNFKGAINDYFHKIGGDDGFYEYYGEMCKYLGT